MTDKPVLLQLCPLSPALEEGMAKRYAVHRLFEDSDADGWVAANGASVVSVATGGHIGIPTALMEQLPALGLVAINGVGFDKVDLEVAKARGVHVTTTPDVLTEDVADLAVGLTIALLRNVVAGDAHVRAGLWPAGERPLARKVSGNRFGIVGLGKIGLAIATRLAAFGPVSYIDLVEKPVPHRFVGDLETLARESDVLILASAANAATDKLVGAAVLDALGPDGVLVNVARGSLVDEAALIEALQQGRIRGAALDVFADEPRVPEALRALENVLLTPHIASGTRETRQRMADIVLDNLEAHLDNRPLFGALV